MLDRLLDFAITTLPETETGFQFDPLMNDGYVLVCRTPPVADRSKPAPWSIFADESFIAMEP